MIEIAYLTSSFVRVVQDGQWFRVQSKRFRGEGKTGDGQTIWHGLFGTHDREAAIKFMESYA